METTLEYRLKNNTYTYLKDVSNVQRSGDILTYTHGGIDRGKTDILTYTHGGIQLELNLQDVVYLKISYWEG